MRTGSDRRPNVDIDKESARRISSREVEQRPNRRVTPAHERSAAPKPSSKTVPAPPPTIDGFERAILTHAVRWLPYRSGMLDHTLVEFGLTPQQYLQRLMKLVNTHARLIHPDLAAELRTVALGSWRIAAQHPRRPARELTE
jgi:hypothetical protein